MSDKPKILIGHTPAVLATGTEAGDELQALEKDQRVAGPGRLGEKALWRLRESGWLEQGRWRRGSYFTTSGLRKATGNPELALLNVPGVFAPAAQGLLKEISDYLLESQAQLDPGEIFVLEDEGFPPMPVTFFLLEPGEGEGPEFGQPMLLVVPLP